MDFDHPGAYSKQPGILCDQIGAISKIHNEKRERGSDDSKVLRLQTNAKRELHSPNRIKLAGIQYDFVCSSNIFLVNWNVHNNSSKVADYSQVWRLVPTRNGS